MDDLKPAVQFLVVDFDPYPYGFKAMEGLWPKMVLLGPHIVTVDGFSGYGSAHET